MTRLVVAATRYPGETRAVVHDADGVPVDLRLFRGTLQTVEGAIWRGRVIGFLSGAKAALLDIGGKLPGFLPFTAYPGGGEALTEGSYVTVMVDRVARGDKGPRLTGKLRLSSPCLVFSPYRKGISTSRRMKGELALRLEEWARAGMHEGEGWVVRGAAAQYDENHLESERDALRQAWAGLQKASDKVACLRQATDPFAEWLAEFSADVDHAMVTGQKVLLSARQVLGQPKVRTILADAFANADGEDVLLDALSPVVPLPSGGQITIEATRAFWAVDVDTNGLQGQQAAQRSNDEAMEALARQLVLRNLGGVIVVDVIPEGRGGQSAVASKRLLKRLRAETKFDARTQVYGATHLGHIELVRARRGTALHEIVHGDSILQTAAELETAVLAKLREALLRVKRGDLSGKILRLSAAELGWLDNMGQHALHEAEDALGQSLTKEFIE